MVKKLSYLFFTLFVIISCSDSDDGNNTNIPKTPEPEKSLLVGEWKEEKYELISGKGDREILNEKTDYTNCENKGSIEFTASKNYNKLTYPENDNGVGCKDLQKTSFKYKVDKATNIILINETDEFLIVELTEKNLTLEKLDKDVNNDGFIDYSRIHYLKK